MKPKITLRKALSDPELLGHALPGKSWRTWRITLMAILGEKLKPDELKTFQALTGRTAAPAEPVNEAAVIVGRRGGKSRALSVLAVYIATLCDHPALVAGETGVALLIAMDKDQANIDLNYCDSVIENSPLLAQLRSTKTADAIVLTNGIEIMARSPSFRRLRGRTAIAVLGDECAFWFQEDRSANPDTEIVAACKPMLATTRGPLLLASSAYAKKGVLYEAWRRDYGPNGDANVLVAKGTSQQFNPSLPDDVIERALERDPEWARAEYLSEWRSDIESFIGRDTVERCVESDVRERPFVMGFTYHGFIDAAGGSGSDSYTLAIAHKHGERVLIDATREVRPPFSPSDVTADFVRLLQNYRITSVRGDRFAGQWVAEAFRAHGINLRPSDLTKSGIYGDFLPMLNTGQVVLLHDERCIAQIASLERRVRFGGKGHSIDHGLKGHDDLANVVAGAAVYAQRSRRSAGHWEGRTSEPRVVLGYQSAKKGGRSVKMPHHAAPQMSTKHDIQKAVAESQIERHLIGDKGHAIALHERAGDGREKWSIFNPAGELLGFLWSRPAAEAAVHQYIEEGAISR